MISFFLSHLLESTVVCLLLVSLACCLRKSARARYAVLVLAAAKFAIPSILLAKTGAEMALFWPAASWLSLIANRVSSVWFALFGFLSGGLDQSAYFAVRAALLIWPLGTLALLTLWFIRLRKRNSSYLTASESELSALKRASHDLGLRLPLALRLSDANMEPALWGILRPTITFPRGLAQTLTPAELEAVLLHELAHARRCDNLSSAFVHLVVCLFWFHPVLWLIERRLNVERERACDETVIASGVAAAIYAAGILKVCKFHLFEATAGVSTMSGADLTRRLEIILDNRISTRLLYIPHFLIACLALLITLVPLAGGYCQQCVSHLQKPAQTSLTEKK